ncbi:V-type ATP synthase subunit F, partial [Dysosmobacter welbionis]
LVFCEIHQHLGLEVVQEANPEVIVVACGDIGVGAGDADGGQARLVKHRTAGHSHAGTVGTQHQADILAHQLRRGGGRLVGSGTVVRVDQLHVVGGATDVHRGGLLIG